MIHELCHGLAAYALGDPTAKQNNRLSLNPLRHIDPIGALMMLFVGFGWAKPVPVDTRYFKRPKLGMAITALAGPVSNFILAALLLFGVRLILFSGLNGGVWVAAFNFLINTAILSIGLGIFNLIPIPPLDGSKVLFSFLPDRIYYTVLRYERFGFAILLLFAVTNVNTSWLTTAIKQVFFALHSLILL